MRTAKLPPHELDFLGIIPPNPPIIYSESSLFHQYLDGLKGIEIGAGAHQPFGLDTLNVATIDPWEVSLYRQIQMRAAGYYYEIDQYAEADQLPFEDHSQDFVLSSHVIEHICNPIAAFKEWQRVVKDHGYIAMIFPHARGLPYGDEDRPITPVDQFLRAYFEHWTDDTAFVQTRPSRTRGHYWVFTLQSMIRLILICNLIWTSWELMESRETDDAAGQGHLLLYKVHKGNSK